MMNFMAKTKNAIIWAQDSSDYDFLLTKFEIAYYDGENLLNKWTE